MDSTHPVDMDINLITEEQLLAADAAAPAFSEYVSHLPLTHGRSPNDKSESLGARDGSSCASR